MDSLITFAAKDLIPLPVLLTLYFLWRLKGNKRRNFIILLIATGLLSLILAKIASHLYYNPRPFLKDGVTPLFTVGHDNGFPSDHTLLAAFLGFAALSYSLRWGVGLLVVALLVGWARVDAGVHHLVDICGSFVFSGLAYLVVYKAQNKYLKAGPKTKAKHSKA